MSFYEKVQILATKFVLVGNHYSEEGCQKAISEKLELGAL